MSLTPTTRQTLLSRARPGSPSPRFWHGVTNALDGARAATTPSATATTLLSICSGGMALAFFVAQGRWRFSRPRAVVVKIPPSRAAARAEALGAALTASLGARTPVGRVVTPADGGEWGALTVAAAAHASGFAAALDSARVALVMPFVRGVRLDTTPAPVSRRAAAAAAADLGSLAIADTVLATRDRTPAPVPSLTGASNSNLLVWSSHNKRGLWWRRTVRVTGLDVSPARLPPAAAASDAGVAATAAAPGGRE